MRAAAEAVLEEGCGAELSKTRGGDTASGGSGVSPPLQLSHHFCFVLLKLLDSTYLEEQIMMDPRRRPLVILDELLYYIICTFVHLFTT